MERRFLQTFKISLLIGIVGLGVASPGACQAMRSTHPASETDNLVEKSHVRINASRNQTEEADESQTHTQTRPGVCSRIFEGTGYFIGGAIFSWGIQILSSPSLNNHPTSTSALIAGPILMVAGLGGYALSCVTWPCLVKKVKPQS